MWVVKEKSTGEIVAGLSAFDSGAYTASHYGCGFYIDRVRKEHLMVWLMDTWFAYSVKHGRTILHLGIFLDPTNTPDERSISISQFKAQFVTRYLQYQPMVWSIFVK